MGAMPQLVLTNALAAHPRLYNTFSANCTNMLAKVVNQTKAGSVPFDLSWYLPGYSDLFLCGSASFQWMAPSNKPSRITT
jgi:hypothetical protein